MDQSEVSQLTSDTEFTTLSEVLPSPASPPMAFCGIQRLYGVETCRPRHSTRGIAMRAAKCSVTLLGATANGYSLTPLSRQTARTLRMGRPQSFCLQRASVNMGRRQAPLSMAISGVEPRTEEELRIELAERNEDLTNMTVDDLEAFGAVDEAFVTEMKKERPYLSQLAEKTAEVLDDILFSAPTNPKESQPLQPEAFRPKVVVLGTGWGSHAFLKSVNGNKFQVTTVSPRNFFLFTPMLAASAVGTVEYRSITEPIRNVNRQSGDISEANLLYKDEICSQQADYLEATCREVDTMRKTVTCENVVCEGTSCTIEDFELPYDYLVVAVGATSNTYNTPGVKEHCIFLKQVQDAQKLRKAIGNCFERANLPGLSDEQRVGALTFAIVGAGPTGVEFTAELRDFIEQEGPRFYPELLKYVRIKLIEASDKILTAFDSELQQSAIDSLTQRRTTLIDRGYIEAEMTELLLQSGVKEVTATHINLKDDTSIPYGLAVWAAGNGPLPLVRDLIDNVPNQKERAAWGRGRLVTDDWLRVVGAPGVFSLGDCAVVEDKPLPQTAQVASQQGSYLGRLFSRGYQVSAAVPQKVIAAGNSKEEGEGVPAPSLSEKLGLSLAEGKFAKPFQFLNLGILAYTGDGSALAQVQVAKGKVKGSGAAGFLLWRSIYLSKQVSWRNRVLVVADWLKAVAFGRDITRF